MIQQVIILLMFIAAVAYLAYLIFKSFQTRSGCTSGCGSCGVDFTKLQKEIDKTKHSI